MTSYPFITDTFRARCINVVDGDTIDVFLDAAFRNYRIERLRLLDVDTPELRDRDISKREDAKAAKAQVAEWVMARTEGEWPIKIQTRKDDSFGRYLADVWWLDKDTGKEHHLNAELITEGLGVEV
ncbi:MAG: thermonuclease family protein [Xanthomonadales bacterium]|nr:thermonuclease family protein [Xanthomonadales bacterium]